MSGLCIHRNLPAVGSSQLHLSVLRPHQSQDQPDHGSLSFTGRAHQSHDLSRICLKGRVCDHTGSLDIGEIHILHPDLKSLFRILIHFPALGNMHFPGQFHQLPDPVGRHRTVQERRDNRHHIAESRGKITPLLKKQSHSSVCNIPGPQPEQTVAESRKLHQSSHNGHENIGLNREQVVLQADVPELGLPPPHLLAVMGSHSKGFNGIKVIDSLYLKSHQLRAHLPNLLAVVPLLLDHKPGHKKHEGSAGQSDHRHDPVIMKNYKESSNKIVNRNNNGRKPADGIAAHGPDISVETVENVSVGILIQRQPVRIYDLVKNIRLDIIINVNAQLGRDPADNTAEGQAEYGTAHHNSDHYPELAGLKSCNNINKILAGHTADQSHRSTENTQDHIKHNGSLIPGAVAEDPLPVLYDLTEGSVPPSGY